MNDNQLAEVANVSVMKMIMSAFVGLLVVILVLGSTPASATTIDECKGLIDVVRTTLDGVDIGGGKPHRIRRSLGSKLEGAKTDLSSSDFA